MSLKTPYSRGIVDLASVFIALGWVGLWFLWPSFSRWNVRPKDIQIPRVSFVRGVPAEGKEYLIPLPIINRQPTDVAGRQDNDAGMLERLLSPPERHPRYLDRNTGAEGKTEDEVIGWGLPPIDLGSYRPIWKDEQVFLASRTPREMHLLSETSGELKKRGFEMPSFTDDEMKQFDKPWEVVVYVEVNESGYPVHVLLETGCEDPRINALVVKVMGRGRIPKPGIVCDGRVTLSYGMP